MLEEPGRAGMRGSKLMSVQMMLLLVAVVPRLTVFSGWTFGWTLCWVKDTAPRLASISAIASWASPANLGEGAGAAEC